MKKLLILILALSLMITAQEYEYTPQSVIGVKNFKEYYENGQLKSDLFEKDGEQHGIK